MLRSMFGMGGTEILVILIVALLFLGPDKLPQAAKTISKGIRDIKKQSRVLQRTIEDDEHIGGAIRDLRSALRGEDEPYRPPPKKELEPGTTATTEVVAAEPASPEPDAMLNAGDSADGRHLLNGGTASGSTTDANDAGSSTSSGSSSDASAPAASTALAGASLNPPAASTTAAATAPTLTFPPTAGQPDDDAPPPSAAEDAELASLVKPAPNTIAHAPRSVSDASKSSGRKHG
jgi:sec-independent protein translocase protein TatB